MWIGYSLVWLQCDLDVMWFGFSVDLFQDELVAVLICCCGMMGCSVDLMQMWIGCSLDLVQYGLVAVWMNLLLCECVAVCFSCNVG